MRQRIEAIITSSIAVKTSVLQDTGLMSAIEKAVQAMVTCFEQGHRMYFCGNGGSAADAQHLAAELSGRFYKNRRALPAEAFHTNTSYLTAVANDYGYDVVYARLVEGICQAGDIVVGLSTSGNSPNIVSAFTAARQKGVITIGMTGENGGEMKSWSDILLHIPSGDTPRIQESHIMIGHILCELTEQHLFDTSSS